MGVWIIITPPVDNQEQIVKITIVSNTPPVDNQEQIWKIEQKKVNKITPPVDNQEQIVKNDQKVNQMINLGKKFFLVNL